MGIGWGIILMMASPFVLVGLVAWKILRATRASGR